MSVSFVALCGTLPLSVCFRHLAVQTHYSRVCIFRCSVRHPSAQRLLTHSAVKGHSCTSHKQRSAAVTGRHSPSLQPAGVAWHLLRRTLYVPRRSKRPSIYGAQAAYTWRCIRPCIYGAISVRQNMALYQLVYIWRYIRPCIHGARPEALLPRTPDVPTESPPPLPTPPAVPLRDSFRTIFYSPPLPQPPCRRRRALQCLLPPTPPSRARLNWLRIDLNRPVLA